MPTQIHLRSSIRLNSMAVDQAPLNSVMNILGVLSDVILPLVSLCDHTTPGKSEGVAHLVCLKSSCVSRFGKGVAVRSSLSLDQGVGCGDHLGSL